MASNDYLTVTLPAYRRAVSIDRDAVTAPYQQLADILRGRIESGEIAAGRRIPSLMELEAEFDLSRGTIRKALDVLKSAGLLVTAPGRGLFVVDQADDGEGG